MIDETAMEFFGDNPESCLAGILCLMSLYRDNPCSFIAHKIIHNLYVWDTNPRLPKLFAPL